jgi:hypothetical protein
MAFAPLDPVLHNQLRLAMVSLLVSMESADFNFLLEKTGATRGNLSVQITKLEGGGLHHGEEDLPGQLPEHALCALTAKGLEGIRGLCTGVEGVLDGIAADAAASLQQHPHAPAAHLDQDPSPPWAQKRREGVRVPWIGFAAPPSDTWSAPCCHCLDIPPAKPMDARHRLQRRMHQGPCQHQVRHEAVVRQAADQQGSQ